MNVSVFAALDELARGPVDTSAMEQFLSSPHEHLKIEDSKQLEKVVQPWVSILPRLAQLADVYSLDEFASIADHCANNYRLVTLLSSTTVLAAMTSFSNIYASTQPFDDNWHYLVRSIEATVGADPYHFGDFVL